MKLPIKAYRFRVTPSPECSPLKLDPGRDYEIEYVDKTNQRVHLVEKRDNPQGFEFHEVLHVYYDEKGRRRVQGFA